MTFTPKMNLPDAATPWGKAMQSRVDDLERGASRAANEGKNANSTQNATLSALAQQIAQTNEVVAQTNEVVSQLDGVVTQLDGVVANLISVGSGRSRQIDFAATSTMTDRAVASILVPPDFTKALISTVTIVSLSNTGSPGSWANLQLQSRIQEVVEGSVVTSVGGGMFGSLTFTQSALLTGLTPGSLIAAAAQVAFFGTSANTFATTTMTATFLKADA